MLLIKANFGIINAFVEFRYSTVRQPFIKPVVAREKEEATPNTGFKLITTSFVK